MPSANAITAEFGEVSLVRVDDHHVGHPDRRPVALRLRMLPNPGGGPYVYALAGVGLLILAVAWFVMPGVAVVAPFEGAGG